MSLSAVQVDEESSYTADDTSFEGFEGEVRGASRAWLVESLVISPCSVCAGVFRD